MGDEDNDKARKKTVRNHVQTDGTLLAAVLAALPPKPEEKDEPEGWHEHDEEDDE